MSGAEIAAGALFAERYRVAGLLARGGMGAVYRAFDERLGEPVALKVLPLDTPEGEDSITRFRREVRLARRVTHRNVARVFDLGQADGLTYLTMELIEGQSLRQVLHDRTRLSPREAIETAIAIAEGLAAAHAAGVVHRDLKPANVVVERATGRVVVTDFGIARSLVDDDGLKTIGAIGTPAYMAPEQLLGSEVDGRTDLYALGVVLFELLAGARPFGGPDEARARLVGAPPDPRVHVGLPDEAARAVMRLLARDPATRPASAADAAAMLRGCLTLDLERTSRPPPMMPRGGDRTLYVIPFEYRGDDEQAFLGEALAEELGNLLTRTRGLRVIAQSPRDGDAREAALRKGASVIVEGEVDRSAASMRVVVRVVENTETGWRALTEQRFEGSPSDLFAFQETMAARIAEMLRVELATAVHAGDASREAVDLYLLGRHQLKRILIVGPDGAVARLDECLALAPRFKPAIAAHAVAAVRGWFLMLMDQATTWEPIARASVERALQHAPDFPETHLAAGQLAAQIGRFREAALALTRAIEIAPTCVPAHEYLAGLELQAGRSERGLERARFVSELDGLVFVSLIDVARHHLLHGRLDEHARALEEVDRRGASNAAATLQLRMRAAAWRGDTHGALHYAQTLERQRHAIPIATHYVEVAGGKRPPAELQAFAAEVLPRVNPRWGAYGCQIVAEALGLRGDGETALEWARRASELAFVDLDWIDWCPALDPARSRPGWVQLRRQVMASAEAIWAE